MKIFTVTKFNWFFFLLLIGICAYTFDRYNLYKDHYKEKEYKTKVEKIILSDGKFIVCLNGGTLPKEYQLEISDRDSNYNVLFEYYAEKEKESSEFSFIMNDDSLGVNPGLGMEYPLIVLSMLLIIPCFFLAIADNSDTGNRFFDCLLAFQLICIAICFGWYVYLLCI